MTEYPNMPEPLDFNTFGGVRYPFWVVTVGQESVKVSTTELQRQLFVGGDTSGPYVSDHARELDRAISFYVDHDGSVAEVRDAIWDVKPQETDNPRWSVIGNCIYNGDDLGSLVAECSSRAIASVLAEHANSNPELRKKVSDAR